MNSIVLMAELLTDPELRRTPDNQGSIASFLAQFAGGRAEDAPYKIKVVGWNNLADEIIEKYHKGDQVVVEGRLRLDLIDRGSYKEKRTELVAQRIHTFGDRNTSNQMSEAPRSEAPRSEAPRSERIVNNLPSSPPNNVVPIANYAPTAMPANDAVDYDDIPF
jgi:single-stranded DNA-binding protein